MGDRRLPGIACFAELSCSNLTQPVLTWFIWQGLGEELALVFAAHGARLILTARNTERLQVLTYAFVKHIVTLHALGSRSCFSRVTAEHSFVFRSTEAFSLVCNLQYASQTTS